MAPHMSNSEATQQIRWGVVTAVFSDIDAELVHAVGKHGLAKTPLSPAMGAKDAFIILAEEVGEVAKTLTYDNWNPRKYEQELIQVAAMAAAMIVGSRLRGEEVGRDGDPN